MSAQHTRCPRFLVMAGGADPKDKGIHDSQFGHYGVTFAKVSFADEYSHMPEYGAKMAAEYAERVAAALNACEGIPVEVLKANAAGGLPYCVADQIDARVEREEMLAALESASLHRHDNVNDWLPKVQAVLAKVIRSEA